MQKQRASGLALVIVTMWSTGYRAPDLDILRPGGESFLDELLAHLAPLGGQALQSNRRLSLDRQRPLDSTG